jgi:hypothetical protein
LLEFDKETNFQYTELIQKAVDRAYDDCRGDKRISKLGLFYYVLRPDRAFRKVKKYVDILGLSRKW